jgi:hypothetical protein
MRFNKDDLGFRSTQTVRGVTSISEVMMMEMVMLRGMVMNTLLPTPRECWW